MTIMTIREGCKCAAKRTQKSLNNQLLSMSAALFAALTSRSTLAGSLRLVNDRMIAEVQR